MMRERCSKPSMRPQSSPLPWKTPEGAYVLCLTARSVATVLSDALKPPRKEKPRISHPLTAGSHGNYIIPEAIWEPPLISRRKGSLSPPQQMPKEHGSLFPKSGRKIRILSESKCLPTSSPTAFSQLNQTFPTGFSSPDNAVTSVMSLSRLSFILTTMGNLSIWSSFPILRNQR